jgi:NADH-quinone oxidoreductase subunit N
VIPAALRVLAPEAVLLLAACVALFGEHIPGIRRSIAGFGAAAATIAALLVMLPHTTSSFFGSMLLVDPTASFARVAIGALTAVFLLWLAARGMGRERSREAAALVLFAALGGMLMTSANDLVTLYLALELATMPAYVLIGYARTDERGLEGTLKYYLLSLLTSLIMLFGLALLFTLSGSTAYGSLELTHAGTAGLLAAVFVAVGFLAKMSAAPFHYWAPDAYAGAPAASVAFVSSVPKVAGLVAMARLLLALSGRVPGLSLALGTAAVLSMLLGNLAAYPQTDLRRLMAYSGVAHVGYLLVALTAGSAGMSAAVYYAVAYAVPSMAIMLISAEEGVTLESLESLASRAPWKAWVSVLFFLSLIGIPPLAGFFGKLYLFGVALDAGLVPLVVFAVAMSVVSLGYYFRVVRAMFARPSAETVPAAAPSAVAASAIVVLAVATVAVGIAAGPLLAPLGFSFP